MPKVLLVLTSASKMGEKPTGAWDIHINIDIRVRVRVIIANFVEYP